MKLHLPKRLLTALLAAFTAISLSTGSAAWGAAETIEASVTWTSDEDNENHKYARGEYLTVQGDGVTLTIDGETVTGEATLSLKNKANVIITGDSDVTISRLVTHDSNSGGTSESVTLNGGFLNITDSDTGSNNFWTAVLIGHWGSSPSTSLNVNGGQLNVLNGTVQLGFDSAGSMVVTGGTANIKKLNVNKGTLTLSGGRLNIGSGGLVGGANQTATLTGGTLGVLDAGGLSLGNVTTTIGTIAIDTNVWDATTNTSTNTGANINLIGNIQAAAGGMAITLAGSGSLTINRTLAGTITTSDSAKVILASNSDWKDFGATYVNANGESSASGFVNTLQVAQAGSTFANSQIYIGDTAYTVTDGIADVLSMSKVFYINDAQKYDASAAEGATSFLVRETGIFDLTGATANSVPIINHGQVELTSTGFLNQITNKSTGIVYLNEDEGQQLLKLTGSFEGKTLNTTVDGNVVTSSGGNFNGYLTVLSGTTLKANTVDALGSHDKAITIQKGATLDVNGKSSYNKLILEGGAILANDSENRTGGNSSVLDHRQLDVITLNGDAEIRGKGTFGMVGNSWNVSNLYLNNHTFTKTGTGEFLLVNTNIAAGTILVREGTMTAKSHSNNTVDITAAHVQVESSGTFYQTGSDEQLGSLTLNGGTVKTDANKLTVSGHALLNSGTINANLIVNNATIESAASVSSGKTLTFAENSQLFISEKQVTQSGFVASGLTGTLITGAGTVTLGAGMTASFAGASVSLSQAAGALTFTTTTEGTTYVVVTGDTQNATDTVAETSGFTGYYVQEQGILNLTVAEGTLSNTNAAYAITSTRGTGSIVVNSEVSINQRNISTVFDGDIQINAGGGLKLGSDTAIAQRDNGTANLAGGVILNGGQLWFHGQTMNLDKLTSINDASVFRVYDMAANNRMITVGEMDLQEDLMLLTRPDGSDVGWKYTMNVGVLKGSGTLSTHSYERSDLTVNDVTNYTGQINLGNNSTLKLGAGSGTLKVGVNHANAQVQALDGWTGTVFLSGGADGLNVKNLESAANSASKLRFNGLTGWLDNTMNVDIILQNSTGTGDNTALKLNNGSSTAKNTANFAKSVSGSGDMKYMWTGGTIGYVTSHVFSGDTSSWDGWFISGANAGKKVEAVFTAGGNVFDAAGNGGVKDERTSGYHLNVTIDAANDNVTSFNGSIINANQLTVNSDTNFNQNVNTASTILASGVEITLGQQLSATSSNKTTYTLGTLTAAANGNTINLNNGATLEALTKGNGSGTITLTGSGIYKLESNSTTSNVSGLTDAAWTGTVAVADTSQTNQHGEAFIFATGYNSLYNEHSFLQITNAKGYLEGTLKANLKLVNGRDNFAIQLANGSASRSYDANFSGTITGTGNIVYVWEKSDASQSTTHIFSNDTSGWKGQFIRDITNYNATSACGKVTNVNFTYGGDVFSSADDSNGGVVDMDNSGRLNVTIDSGEKATRFNGKLENIATVTVNSETDFNNFVTATTITLNQDATFSGKVTANTLSVAADKSITLNGGTAEAQMIHSIGKLSAASADVSLGSYSTLALGGGTAESPVTHSIGKLSAASGMVTLSANAELIFSGDKEGEHVVGTLTTTDATITVNEGATITAGGLNLYKDGNNGKGSTLYLVANSVVKVPGSDSGENSRFSMDYNSTVELEEGAMFYCGDLLTITGLRHEGDTKTTLTAGAWMIYSESNGNFVINNAKVQYTKTEDHTLGNRLTNSSLTHIGTGTLTVNNSNNTITSLAAEGGHVKLSESMSVQSISAKAGKVVTVANGKTISMAGGVSLSANGANATMTAKTDTALLQMQENTSFTIADMELSNVNIEAANAGDRINLSGLSASDVQLTKGEFHMLDKAQPQVGTGGSAINLVEGGPTGLDFSTSLLNGMTLGADASMVVDLGDLSGFTGMDSGKPTFSITLEGFRLSDYTGTGENKGLYFASDSWLGQLLVAQGASDYVKDDSLEAGAQATAGTGSGVSVSYNSTAVGTVIIISGLQVPEPATSTLGLIALTALVSRRRRK